MLRPFGRRGSAVASILAVLTLLVAACSPTAAATPTATTASKPTAAAPAAPSAAASPAASPAAVPSAGASPAAAPSPSAATQPGTVPVVAGYPAHPLDFVIPYGPGGGYDAIARQLAVPLARILGQPVVVKNVPGGGARIGAREFQQAPADGHTLITADDNGLFSSTLVQPPEGFDVTKWQWVAGVRTSQYVLYVRNDSPYKSVDDVLAADKAGQRLRIPHNGLGGGYLNTAVIFYSALGVQNMALISGYNGTGDMVPALIRGDVDGAFLAASADIVQFVDKGDIRPLVSLSRERQPLLPNTPTAAELKLPNADELMLTSAQSGIAVAPGTPADRVKVLEAAVLNALQDQAFVDWAKSAGYYDSMNVLNAADMTAEKQREYKVYEKYQAEFRKYN